jgi:O-antigen/teichoic acid export membrane protein
MKKDVLLPELMQAEDEPLDQLALRAAAAQPGRHKGLAASAVSGFGWLFAQNIGARVIGFLSQIVLARIFAPADFATLALAGTVTAIVYVLANFGVDDALLQRHRHMRFWATPALLVSLGLGLVSMVLVFAAAPVASHIYHAPLLFPVLSLMAVSMPLSALATVPEVKLRNSMNFRFLATYTTVEMVINQVATIALALMKFGIFSFVIPPVVLAAVRAAVLWGVARPELRPLRLRQLGMMANTGATILAKKIVIALVGQGDYFTLGLFAAKPIVGAYYFAFRQAMQPVQMLAGNLQNVMFPVLSKLNNEPARQREAALNASRMLNAVMIPFGFMQAAIARPVISLIFGAKWDAAIPLVQILSIGLAFDAVSWVAGALLQARGEFRRGLNYTCILAPAFFALVVIGAKFGSATGVALGAAVYYGVLQPFNAYAIFRTVGISARQVASLYLTPCLFSVIAIGSGAEIAAWVAPHARVVQFAIIIAVGGGAYIALVRAFTPQTFHQIFGRVSGMVRLRLRRAPALA